MVKLPPLCLKIRKLRLIRTHSIHLLSGPAADTHLQRHLLAQMKVGVPAEPAPVGAAQPCRALGKSGTALSRPDASAGGRSAQRRRVRRLSACHMPAPPFPAIKEARRFSAGTPPNKVSIAKNSACGGAEGNWILFAINWQSGDPPLLLAEILLFRKKLRPPSVQPAQNPVK